MKKVILIIALTIGSVSIYAKNVNPDTTAKKQHIKTESVIKPKVAKLDSIKVDANDLKTIIGAYSQMINNSSDISTKQAKSINEAIKAFYLKYFKD